MCWKENGTDDDEEEEEVNGEVVSEWPDCTVFTDFLTDKKILRIYEKKTNTTTNPYNFPKIRTFFVGIKWKNPDTTENPYIFFCTD